MNNYSSIDFNVIEDPDKYFESLGHLHDARVERVDWLPESQELILFVDDLNSSLLDLPEYKGLAPAMLRFCGVDSVNLKFPKCESHLNVYGFQTSMSSSGLEIIIKFWPSGQCDLQCSSVGVKEL